MDEKLITDRELQILRLVAEGHTSPRIAQVMNLSPETIKWYRKRLLAKFQAENTAELIRLAMENKII